MREFWDPAKQQLGQPWCRSFGTMQNNNWDIHDAGVLGPCKTTIWDIHEAGVWGPCKITIGTSMMQEFWDPAKKFGTSMMWEFWNPAKQQSGQPWCGSFGTLQKKKKLGHPWCKSFGILQDIYVGHKWCASFEILQNNSWDIHDVSYEILQDIPVGQMMCKFWDPATYQQRCALFGNLQDTSGTPMTWVLLRIWRKRGEKQKKNRKKRGQPWSKHFENLQDNKLDTNDAQVFESCKTTNRTCIMWVSSPLCSPLKSSTKCSSV